MAVLGGLVIHVDYAKQTNADAVVRKLVRPSDRICASRRHRVGVHVINDAAVIVNEGMCAEPARSDRPRYDNQLTAINS